jgi:hypothetical protein
MKNWINQLDTIADVTNESQEGNKKVLDVFGKIWDIKSKKPFFDVRKTDVNNVDEFFERYLKNGKEHSFYPFLKNQFNVFGNTFIPEHLSITGSVVSYFK